MELEKKIKNIIKEKTVLDCGAIGAEDININSDFWIHRILKKHAKKVVGIDIDEKSANQLRDKGYDIRVMNCEDIDMNEKFDVVFAGELIEHLSNPGKFLDGVYSVLKKDGILIITTPNQYSIFRVIGAYFNKTNEHREHTHVHNEDTLKNLLTRHNFKVEKIDYFTSESFFENGSHRNLKKILKPISKILYAINKKFNHQIIIIVRR